MKNRLIHKQSPRSGFALVIVLAILVLLVGLAAAILMRVTTEHSSVASYQASVASRQLADVAVSLVQGQINLATTQGSTVAWASQPGMVRTFDTSGNTLDFYKLYSAPNMITSNAAQAINSSGVSADAPPATWSSMPSQWVDLNAPVTIDGNTTYPIVDPSSIYPAQTATAPDGFSITSAPGATANQPAPMPVQWLYELQDGSLIAPDSVSSATSIATFTSATEQPSATNPIIGRIAFWTDDDSCKVNINTASDGWLTPNSSPTVSQGLPGSFWDTPHAVSAEDQNWAFLPPAQNEFQRYPGHPATTCLSSVLKAPTGVSDQTWAQTIYGIVPRINGGGSQGGTVLVSAWSNGGNAAAQLAALTTPGNRLYANIDELIFDPTRAPQPNANTSPSTYTTKDINNNSVTLPILTPGSTTALTKAQLEQTKFFLTARSRAPETNLFNLPRIAAWPIYLLGSTGVPDTNHTTAKDQLIAFCSSTGTIGDSGGSYHPYIFQREISDMSTTSTTDTSGVALGDATLHDISLPRNLQLYKYLQYLTSQSIPGYGNNFNTKYPNGDRDQILTEIFDYIRCIDLEDGLLSGASYSTISPYCFTPTNQGWVVPSLPPTSLTSGIQTKGFGRSYTLSGLSMIFICNANATDPTGTVVTESPGSTVPSGCTAATFNDPTTSSNAPATNTVLGGTSGGTVVGIPLLSGEKYIQAMILPQLFSPMQGFIPLNTANMQMSISGLSGLTVTTTSRTASGSIGVASTVQLFSNLSPVGGTADTMTTTFPVGNAQEVSRLGGDPSYRTPFIHSAYAGALGPIPADKGTNGTTGAAVTETWPVIYPWIGTPVIISCPAGAAGATGGTMTLNGATLTVDIFAGSTTTTQAPIQSSYSSSTASKLIQTFQIIVPSKTFPIPELVAHGISYVGGTNPTNAVNFPGYSSTAGASETPLATVADAWWGFSRTPIVSTLTKSQTVNYTISGVVTPTVVNVAGGRLRYGADRIFSFGQAGDPLQPKSAYWRGAFVRPEYDTIRSMVPKHGDFRLAAATYSDSGGSIFGWHPTYSSYVTGSGSEPTQRMEATLYGPNNSYTCNSTSTAGGNVIPGNDPGGQYAPVTYNAAAVPDIQTGATVTPASTGDFDNGLYYLSDGAFINKPDEGDSENFSVPSNLIQSQSGSYSSAIVNNNNTEYVTPTLFSPNRIMPSPVMFGSLPTGVFAGVPWRTLLFRPQTNHFGSTTLPEDELLLDLFWNPVVEPYAISDRFSTAGKINMNYQILPFTYITRKTGMYAILKAQKMAVYPNANASTIAVGTAGAYSTNGAYAYKGGDNTAGQAGIGNSVANIITTFHYPIDTATTLTQFDTKFSSGQIYKSPAEICDIHMVPSGYTAASGESNTSTSNIVAHMADTSSAGFWAFNAITGDNLRERIYATVYPRLTTKSNTFTVHFLVQSLKKFTKSNTPTEWIDGQDLVTGEYRGSTTLERFINANNTSIPDYAADIAAGTYTDKTLDTFYKWRVVENRQFAP